MHFVLFQWKMTRRLHVPPPFLVKKESMFIFPYLLTVVGWCVPSLLSMFSLYSLYISVQFSTNSLGQHNHSQDRFTIDHMYQLLGHSGQYSTRLKNEDYFQK